MNAILSITGSVTGVDPQGYARVGGIAFAIPVAQLPQKGQIVKIAAQLIEAPGSAQEAPVWTAVSVIAFNMPQATVARPPASGSTAPVASPTRTTTQTPVQTGAKPAGTGRFGHLPATGTKPRTPATQARPAMTLDELPDDSIPF